MAKKPEIKRTLSNLNTRTAPEKQYHFQYWADGLDLDFDRDAEDFERQSEYYLEKVMQLAALRRAAGNFVRILTGDDQINVQYSSGKESYTDGKTVVISAEADPSKFDKTVAVALHESAHCLLSDFTFLNLALKVDPLAFLPESTLEAMKARSTVDAGLAHLGLIMNVMEDRRIDDFVYRTAVGYRPYYDVLYRELWHSKEVSKALRIKPEWRKPTVAAYMERMINLSNPVAYETRDALPGLEEIYRLIDISRIQRFNNEPNSYRTFMKDETRYIGKGRGRQTIRVPDLYAIPRDWYISGSGRVYGGRIAREKLPAMWLVACQVLEIIYKNALNPVKQPKADPQEQEGEGESYSELPNLDGAMGIPDESDEGTPKPGNRESEAEDEDTEDDSEAEDEQPKKRGRPSKKERDGQLNEKKLAKEMDKIRKFVAGDTKKKKLERNIADDVTAMDSADATIHHVGNDQIGRGRVLVTERLTNEIINSKWWSFAQNYGGEAQVNHFSERAVQAGVRMGQILLHRLQVRNEQLVTKFPNQLRGHIDRRQLARLGMEMENVFNRQQEDKYRPALIHLSLDASGSMSGNKWMNALTVATALSYAAQKIQNMEVVVSIRGDVNGNSGMAHLAIIHDTRRYTFGHFRKFAVKLAASGSTPEGLCYEAIMEELMKDAQDYAVYFVNVSDGEPTFTSLPAGSRRPVRRRRRWGYPPPPQTESNEQGIQYSGETAWHHTRHQVNKMREAGIRVLSYFVGEGRGYGWKAGSNSAFRIMYGEDASFINVTQVTGIINTMNKLLLKKG